MYIEHKNSKERNFRIINHYHQHYANRNNPTPHEWQFIDLLYKIELKKDKNIAKQVAMYILQNSMYEWVTVDPKFIDKIISDSINGNINKESINYIDEKIFEMVLIESQLNNYIFDKYYKIQAQNRNVPLPKDESYYKSKEYGDLVTEFMIRTLGYSLIGNSKQKIIITSMSDCAKRFEKYLEQGFSLQRLSKTKYIDHSLEERIENPLVTGHFEYLPVLPTNSPYKIDEIIETKDKTYKKVIY